MSRNFLTPLILPAGTASQAPLSLQSGTNLTTAAAGAVEYDGKVWYTTPAGRGVSPSIMFYRLNSGLAGANTIAVQSLFGVGVTLSASTVYAFECRFILTKTAGTTSHTVGLSFEGTATLNNIFYNGVAASSATALSIYGAQAYSIASITANNLTITPAVAAATYHHMVVVSGTVSINAGGTFTPSYKLSSSPGGAYTTTAGSYFAIWPIGAAGANTSVGPWA